MAARDEIRPLIADDAGQLNFVRNCPESEPLFIQSDPVLVTDVQPADEDYVVVDHGLLSRLIVARVRNALYQPHCSTSLYLVERESLNSWLSVGAS